MAKTKLQRTGWWKRWLLTWTLKRRTEKHLLPNGLDSGCYGTDQFGHRRDQDRLMDGRITGSYGNLDEHQPDIDGQLRWLALGRTDLHDIDCWLPLHRHQVDIDCVDVNINGQLKETPMTDINRTSTEIDWTSMDNASELWQTTELRHRLDKMTEGPKTS